MDGSAYNYQGDITINIAGNFVLVGDLNGDGVVQIQDLLGFLEAYGVIGDDLAADLNNDGSVTTQDLLILLSAFGTSAPDSDGPN